MKFNKSPKCKSEIIYKKSQEINKNKNENEKGCLWGISVLFLVFLLVLIGIIVCTTTIYIVN